ncbi:MAG: DUF2318 domain-containing protein [Clostridiales bacterium]|jgi:uncharacterized membrane protein|nr:DUF2318 domain-containing protein [Clostridiales bacterium]
MRFKKSEKGKALMQLAAAFIVAFALSGCSSDDTRNAESIEIRSDDEARSDEPLEIKENESLIIPVGEISETAKFYPVKTDGVTMEIIAVKASDGSIRTAFNTCEVCYDSGRGYYKQSGNALICQNCGNSFQTDQIEIRSNGCNPWPIFASDKTVTDESIEISYDFLSASTEVFANWKRSY